MKTVADRIACDLGTIVDLAEKNGTLGHIKSVAIYFDETEMRTIIKALSLKPVGESDTWYESYGGRL